MGPDGFPYQSLDAIAIHGLFRYFGRDYHRRFWRFRGFGDFQNKIRIKKTPPFGCSLFNFS
jgi:hypothetical protein